MASLDAASAARPALARNDVSLFAGWHDAMLPYMRGPSSFARVAVLATGTALMSASSCSGHQTATTDVCVLVPPPAANTVASIFAAISGGWRRAGCR